MDEQKKYHNFPRANSMKLRDVLPMIRCSGYSNYDETGTVIISPECEEWTCVEFNLSSCLLDLLGDLIVERIDADEGKIRLWIKTDEFNWIKPKEDT